MRYTPERFNNAISKLYNAFHNGQLNANDGCACAVGNLLDGYDGWELYRNGDLSGFCNRSIEISKDGYKNFLKEVAKSGYSPNEIFNVEKVFLNSMGYSTTLLRDENYKSKELQFKGLEAVVKYLCELEEIENIMDYSKLFKYTEDNEPVYSL